ncbi:MAG: glycerophosphodiester phosphodiesterase [Ardenticatenaceae bacterium]
MSTAQTDSLNIAHRGARSLAPENTMAAARRALELGADMWELDVAMSADGILYLVHDDTLERTSNVAKVFPERQPWSAHTFTWEEIQRLDFGSWYNRTDPFGQIASGKVSEGQLASYAGEPAPSLEEALCFTRENDWRVNVEIKDLSGTAGDAKVVEMVVALIESLGMARDVLISSFNHRYLERVRLAGSFIATGVLVAQPESEPAILVRELQAQAYHPGVYAIHPSELPALREAGVEVNVWTVNDEAIMRALIEHGVNGIFTDFPQRLRTVVTPRPAQRAPVGDRRRPRPA